MNSFYIQRLGCPKNDVDADYIAGFLRLHQLVQVDRPEDADLLIVNSCGFIQAAKEESIDAVLALAKLKENQNRKKLVITGCLSQRYADELRRDIPELDGIFGINDFAGLKEVIEGTAGQVVIRNANPMVFQGCDFPRAINPAESYGYIKIADGCDNRCSYCAIPNIRGRYRSSPIDDICREARWLLDNGKRELILVSQESSAFGRDLYGKPRLIELLERLIRLDGDFWIRVMYLHPARIDAELVDYMIDNPKICNYFDVPVQHIDDALLRAMGRKVTSDQIERVIDLIRARQERAAIRTTVMVGFPGETEAQFEDLCRFIEKRRFDRLGAFTYSAEDETPAAALPGRIDDETKEWRQHRLMEIQQEIAFENNRAEKGRQLEVIVDGADGNGRTAVGRTRFDAPEIDQTVRFDSADVNPGDLITVTITGCDGYDLLGERGTHEPHRQPR